MFEWLGFFECMSRMFVELYWVGVCALVWLEDDGVCCFICGYEREVTSIFSEYWKLIHLTV